MEDDVRARFHKLSEEIVGLQRFSDRSTGRMDAMEHSYATGAEHMAEKFTGVERRFALVEEQVKGRATNERLESAITLLDEKLDVVREGVAELKKIIYGGIGVVLVIVVGAVLALVLRAPLMH